MTAHQDDSTSYLQPQSHLFRLPVELRIAIYEQVLGPIQTRPLYIARDLWAWKQPKAWSQPSRRRKFLNVLLVCRRVHDETVDILYRKHELCLITECTRDLKSLSQVRRRICPIEDYTRVLRRVNSFRLTLFMTGELYQANVIVALLSWIKAILSERHTPLKRMTVVFCATAWKLEYRPTAVVYAAQGFRDLASTRFEFQCGFSGTESVDAMLALAEHANQKCRRPQKSVSSEAALKELLKAWRNIVRISMSPRPGTGDTLTSPRYKHIEG